MGATSVRYRRLGDSDLLVSDLGLGGGSFGNRVDVAQTREVVAAALDHGVTFFDTADTYGAHHGASEEALGQSLAKRRANVVLATKFGMDIHRVMPADLGNRGSGRYITAAVESSLRRLRTDWIDLYQMHLPDESTPIQETLAALNDLVAAGKVRCLGSSNFAAWQVVDADWIARTSRLVRFVSAQNKYSIYDRAAEAELIPACLRTGVSLMPYWPLEYGLLTGKYCRGEPAPMGSRLAKESFRLDAADFDRIEALGEVAAQLGVTLLELAIGGLAALPAVTTVIAGATSRDQIAANVAAVSWQPSQDDLAALRLALPLTGDGVARQR